MTKKSLKIFLILLVLFSVYTIGSSAANINLNLPGTDSNQSNETTTNNQTVANNEVANNTQSDANAIDTNNTVADTTQDNPLDDMQTLQPTPDTSHSGLSITDIINILLITVGVILILLAIAIIIRLK